MNKTKRVPFSIEKAKRGAKVVTRCGYPVRIALFDVKNDEYPVAAAVRIDEGEIICSYTLDGKHGVNEEDKKHNVEGEDIFDLFIEEEVEETDDYNPYKEAVKSIPDMIESYHDEIDLRDFYDNVKVKCREAIEYDKKWCKKQEEHRHSVNLKIMPDQWYTCIESWSTIDMKIGDWFEEGYYYLGSDILKYKGLLEEGEDYKDYFHPWTIQDAKDGDVLCYETKDEFRILTYKNGCVYFHCHYYNEHLTTVDSYFVIPKHLLCYIHPATKEQRELLFQKMKEAGYEWDSNKKELKKIEEVKKRRMTNKEIADWLREAPEEKREFMYKGGGYVYSHHVYLEREADKPAEDIIIRKNGVEWQEPIIEI